MCNLNTYKRNDPLEEVWKNKEDFFFAIDLLHKYGNFQLRLNTNSYFLVH